MAEPTRFTVAALLPRFTVLANAAPRLTVPDGPALAPPDALPPLPASIETDPPVPDVPPATVFAPPTPAVMFMAPPDPEIAAAVDTPPTPPARETIPPGPPLVAADPPPTPPVAVTNPPVAPWVPPDSPVAFPAGPPARMTVPPVPLRCCEVLPPAVVSELSPPVPPVIVTAAPAPPLLVVSAKLVAWPVCPTTVMAFGEVAPLPEDVGAGVVPAILKAASPAGDRISTCAAGLFCPTPNGVTMPGFGYVPESVPPAGPLGAPPPPPPGLMFPTLHRRRELGFVAARKHVIDLREIVEFHGQRDRRRELPAIGRYRDATALCHW